MKLAVVLAVAFAMAHPGEVMAQGGAQGGADCPRDLAESTRLIRAIQARDRDPGVARGDTIGMCRVVRQNQADMTQARALKAPCLSGRDRRETLAMIDANLADIREVLARHCQ